MKGLPVTSAVRLQGLITHKLQPLITPPIDHRQLSLSVRWAHGVRHRQEHLAHIQHTQ